MAKKQKSFVEAKLTIFIHTESLLYENLYNRLKSSVSKVISLNENNILKHDAKIIADAFQNLFSNLVYSLLQKTTKLQKQI